MDNEQLLQQLVDKLLAHNNRSLDQEARDLKWRKQKFFLVLFLLIAGALLYIQALATVFGSKVQSCRARTIPPTTSSPA